MEPTQSVLSITLLIHRQHSHDHCHEPRQTFDLNAHKWWGRSDAETTHPRPVTVVSGDHDTEIEERDNPSVRQVHMESSLNIVHTNHTRYGGQFPKDKTKLSTRPANYVIKCSILTSTCLCTTRIWGTYSDKYPELRWKDEPQWRIIFCVILHDYRFDSRTFQNLIFHSFPTTGHHKRNFRSAFE